MQRSSPTVSGVEIIGCGEIESHPVGKIRAPRTELGYVQKMNALEIPVFKGNGTTILARSGTHFGIRVNVKGAPIGKVVSLVTRVTHPPIRNPNTGRETSSDEWDNPMNIGIPRYTGWVFDHPWELVPGEWRIQLLSGNKVMVEKKFIVRIGQ